METENQTVAKPDLSEYDELDNQFFGKQRIGIFLEKKE